MIFLKYETVPVLKSPDAYCNDLQNLSDFVPMNTGIFSNQITCENLSYTMLNFFIAGLLSTLNELTCIVTRQAERMALL